MKLSIHRITAAALLLGVTAAANAVPVTLAGSNVDFTFDDSLLGLYGTPSVSGDTLYFTPTTFSAQSANGDGQVLTSATANIQATVHNGATFSGASLDERGDYLLLGSGTSVDVTGQLRAFDVAAPQTDASAALMTASPLTTTGVPTQNWTAAATLDMGAMKGASTVNFTLENLLLASLTDDNSLAFVQKKYAGLSVATAPVPEAQTAAMMLAGLGLVGFSVSRVRRNGR